MMEILWPIVRPFLGYIVGVVALLGALSGFYFKAKHDGVVAEKAKIEQEKIDAIQKGNKARERIKQLCDGTPMQCGPSDWYRD
jgi:hypothetical protein